MTTLIFYLPFLAVYALLAIYAERKISAFIQDRLGPMEAGYYGIIQSVADFIKLLQKEDIVPYRADAPLFKVAPFLIFAATFGGFAVLPVAPAWSGAAVASGLFLLLAIVALDVIGIMIAGWSSGNKYSMLGTFRSAAQIISYEIPLGMSILCVCMVGQTLDLQEICYQQSVYTAETNYLLGLPALGIETTHLGGFLSWNIFRMPALFFAWIIFFIASLAECNRAPFDLPEAESELVAGFQTEYTGFRWAVIMLAEYGMMLLVSILGAILFFGGWNSPFPQIAHLNSWTSGEPGTIASLAWGIFWLVSKALFFVAVQIWIRWTYPRLRVDQLMALSWKYLTPAALLLVIICGIWKIYFA